MAKSRIAGLTFLALMLLAAGMLGARPAMLALTAALSLSLLLGFTVARALGGLAERRREARARWASAAAEETGPPLPSDPNASREWLDTLGDIRALPEVRPRARRRRR